MDEGAGDIREIAEQRVDSVKLEFYHNELSDSLSTWEKVQNPPLLQMGYVYLTFFRSNKLGNTLSLSDDLGQGLSHERNLNRSLKILVLLDRGFYAYILTSFHHFLVEIRSVFAFPLIGDCDFLIGFFTDCYNEVCSPWLFLE